MEMDLSYLEALMGGAAAEAAGATGGVWVVSLEGAVDDGLLRLIGKARVVADALGSYVYLLQSDGLRLAGSADAGQAQAAIHAGADNVLLASGVPTLPDLADFFRERAPRAILFPRTPLGRVLGPGLAQTLGGGLCGYAADLTVDPIYQRIVAHQPILEDAARQAVSIVAAPAVVVVDTAALPAAFNEPWRSGNIEETGLTWATADLPLLFGSSTPEQRITPEQRTTPEQQAGQQQAGSTLADAAVVVAAGRGLKDAAGFALAEKLAQMLGGVVAGDLAALDAGWITDEQLVGLTGRSVAPKLYLALGIRGDTGHLMAIEGARIIIAVQPDPAAAIVPVADYNVLTDPKEFAEALLAALEK
jgi:electron transfer flavoprotein alpha subunit